MVLVTVSTPSNEFLGSMTLSGLLAVAVSGQYDRLHVAGLETLSGEAIDAELSVAEIEQIIAQATFGRVSRELLAA